MKKLLLLLVCFSLSYSICAQTTPAKNQNDNNWSRVEKLETQGKFTSAYKKIKSIYQKAERQNDNIEFVKAFFYKAKYQLLLKEGAQKEVYREFRRSIKKHDTPVKQVLASVLAESLNDYHKQNHYKIRRRTATDSTATDFKTWTKKDFKTEIRHLQKLSITDENRLLDLPQKKFTEILSYGENYGKFRSSLYDLLAKRLLDQLDNQYIFRSNGKFKINNEAYFSSPEKFTELKLDSSAENKAKFRSLKLYQNLTELHDKNHLSQFFVTLDRFDFVHDNWQGQSHVADSLYIQGLSDLKTEFISNTEHRWISYKLGRFFHNNADKEKHPDYEKKALTQLQNVLNHSQDKSHLQSLAKKLKENILKSDFNIKAKQLALPDKASKLLVRFRNTDTLYLSVYPRESGFSAKSDSVKQYITSHTPVTSKMIVLPEVDDHYQYSAEYLLPAVSDYGQFLVVASTHKNIEVAKDIFSTTSYQVSRLSLRQQEMPGRTRFLVSDRITGAPLQNATIKIKNTGEELVTDKQGKADLTDFKPQSKHRYNYPAKVSYRDDKFTYSFDYKKDKGSKKEDEKDLNIRAELLSDRSIYRPGQEFYFKGIVSAFNNNGSFKKTVQALPVRMKLYNTNHVAVDSVDLKTNAYGSVNGKFDLPENGLTGDFHLKMESHPSDEKAKKFVRKNSWATRIKGDIEQPQLDFRVEEYKRPKFEVSFDKIDSAYVVKDSVSLTGRAKAFFGGSITDRPVRYTVNRQMARRPGFRPYSGREQKRLVSDTVLTKADGRFNLQFKATADRQRVKENKPVFNYTIEATVTDINGETHSAKKEIRIGYHATEVMLSVPDNLEIGKNQSVEVIARDLNTDKSSAAGTLKLFRFEDSDRLLKRRDLNIPDFQQIPKEKFLALFPHQVYSKKEKRNSKKSLIKSFEIDTQKQDSIAVSKFGNLSSSGNYMLQFTGEGKRGFPIETKKHFAVFNPQKPLNQLSDFVEIHQEMQPEKNRVHYSLETRDSIYVYWELADAKNLRDEKGFWLSPGTTDKYVRTATKARQLNLRLTYQKDGYNGKIQKQVKLPEDKQVKNTLKLEVTHVEDKMKPGSTQNWELKVRDKKGQPLNAEVIASMYDSSLDQFTAHKWSPELFVPPRVRHYQNGLPDFKFHNAGPNYRISRPRTFNQSFYRYNFNVTLNYTDFNKFGYDFTSFQNSQKKYLAGIRYRNQNKQGFTGQLSGIVRDKDGIPLPGVNIQVAGTSKATQTDFNGRYSIKVKRGDQLHVNYTGFSPQTLNVQDFNTLDIEMKGNTSTLDEVVVTTQASETNRKNHIVSAVEDEAVNASPESPDINLSEKTPGVNVDKESNSVILRGVGTVDKNERPLFIIDGEIVKAGKLETLTTDDILSVNVLKSAKATSLYGERGANGAMVITTKNAGQELDKVEARKDLKETAFFLPQLKTDKNGNIRFQFKGPEALTRWKFQAFAHDKQLNQDKLSLQSITQKDLNIIPNFPRFFRSGDRVVISAKINNTTDKPASGIAQLKFRNAYTEKEIELSDDTVQKNFSIDDQGNTEVRWRVHIPENTGALRYRISAKAGNFTDAQTDVLPVLSDRLFITESFPFWVNPHQEKDFEFSALKNNDSETLQNHSLRLEYTANPVWTALGALPSLIEFPYACSEQTFARFFGSSLALDLVDKNPDVRQVLQDWKSKENIKTPLEENEDLKSIALKETPWVKTAQSQEQQQHELAKILDPGKTKRKMTSAIRRLHDMQLDSGAFPWFSGGRENRRISLYIFAGFARLQALGIHFKNDANYKEIITGLDRYLSDYYERKAIDHGEIQPEKLSLAMLEYFKAKNQISAVDTNSKLADIKKALLKKYKTDWLELSLRNKLSLALVAQQHGQKSFATTITEALKEQAVINSDNGMYWKENTAGRSWNASPIATQSLAIEAFSKIDKDKEIINRLKEWLLRQKQLQAWESTKATTQAVYALLLQAKSFSNKTNSTQLSLGKTAIDFSEASAKTGYVQKKFTPDQISADKAAIQVDNTTDSPQYGALYWQYFEDSDKVKASNSGELSIEKEWFIKIKGAKADQLQPLDKRKPKIGDLLTVRIVIKADEDFDFMHLKDLRPAGLEPVDVLSDYKYQDGLGYYQSTKDVATHFFFDHLPKGTHVFEYNLRVNNPGDFSGGTTTLQSMYAPEFSVRSAGKRLEVKK